VIAASLVVPLVAQPSDSQEAYVKITGLLRALYPELSENDWVFKVAALQRAPDSGPSGPLVAVTMAVTKSSGTNSGGDNRTAVLTANVEYTAFGELGTMRLDGEYVNAKKSWELEMLAEKAPNASEEAVANRLLSMGAKFGVGKDREMREEALAQFHRLEKILGRIELEDLGLVKNGTVWSGEILVTSPLGRRKYAVLFEPFAGRLKFLMGLNG
jgi:hypothetical protein